MAWVTMGGGVLGDDHLEATLGRIGSREPDASIDKCAGQNQFVYVEITQLFEPLAKLQ